MRIESRFLCYVLTLLATISLSAELARADEAHSDGWAGPAGQRSYPAYQRRRAATWPRVDYGAWPGQGTWSHERRNATSYTPRHQSRFEGAWFQRPYPYHFDYYKMRYRGSYEPYFGNLYGPPAVVVSPNYAPGYYPGGFYR